MGIVLEQVDACPICDEPVAFTPEAVLARLKPYYVLRCPGCTGAYLSPRLGEQTVRSLYDNPSYYGNRDGKRGYYDYRAEKWTIGKTTFDRLQRADLLYGHGKNLLEIGAAFGYSLDLAKTIGYQVVGVDASAAARAELDAKGIDTYSPEELPNLARGYFDVILAFDTLEHVYNLRQLMFDCFMLLKPRGVLLASVPNIESFWAKAMGPFWWEYRLPEHIAYFNDQSFAKMVNPWFSVEMAVGDRQFLSMEMLAHRMGRFRLGGPARFVVKPVRKKVLRVPNGLKLYLVRRA